MYSLKTYYVHLLVNVIDCKDAWNGHHTPGYGPHRWIRAQTLQWPANQLLVNKHKSGIENRQCVCVCVCVWGGTQTVTHAEGQNQYQEKVQSIQQCVYSLKNTELKTYYRSTYRWRNTR